MSQIDRLICGVCKATFEVKKDLRGSRFIELFLWITLVIPGFFYTLWRKLGNRKKLCNYCGSNFILPDSYESRELLKPIEKNNKI